MFIDERLPRMGDADLFRRLEPLGVQARRFALEPDAGPGNTAGGSACTPTRPPCAGWRATGWRASPRVWVSPTGPRHWRAQADALRDEILKRAWNERPRRHRRARSTTTSSTPACCSCPSSACWPASDERFVRTCAVIGKELSRNGFIMRYTAEDDFGLPETAFLVCQFWYIDALASLGRTEEARELFVDLLARRNALRPAVRGHPSRDGRAVGQPAADLLDGRHRQLPAASCRAAGSTPGQQT